MRVRTAFGLARLLAALVCIIALVARFYWGLGTATFNAPNFFAYLTIQSNIAFVVLAILSGVRNLSSGEDPRWLTTMRAVVLSWTVTAGIVFAILIQQGGARGVRVDVPWSDVFLHFVLPGVALIDWSTAPGRGRANWRALPMVVAYPILWGVVTLVRGNFVGWYPYFFLDPAQVSGVGEFSFFCGFALVLFASVAAGIVGITRAPPLTQQRRFLSLVAREPLPRTGRD
ncbi:hypothetical protein B0I08_101733 [Glaciihabitans tibetensis]|uniref:FAR-17a/AIG1-like protein n=1 Tax=Glaciihabitans tibetensis TaxID=1266600 RepID=A0A2T0VK37_9MICO|nr:Pr6Pr family membrane protein [Glaciihabitans tibetensis]PRY70596.1 hypothetical protein B0I08_101733 [Glaciihabitans tibetensis]